MHWGFADLNSIRNIIDDDVLRSLPFQLPLNQQNIKEFGGNSKPRYIKRFSVLPVTIYNTLIWLELAVVL